MGIRYIKPVKPDAAEGLVAEVYAQIKRDFGRIVEPFLLHSPLPKLLAGAWIVSRESEVVGNVPRSYKEVVATTISKLNQCHYCVDAHAIMLNAMGERHIASAVSEARYSKIADGKTHQLVEWALATRTPESEILLMPPFSRAAAPEIIGTAVFYHYINRMVSGLLSKTPLPSNRTWLKRPLKLVAGLIFSRSAKSQKKAGDSLRFLSEAELPADLSWAKTASNVAGAFARFASVVEDVGSFALSPEVRAYVKEKVDFWNGEFPESGRNWIEQAIQEFTGPSRAAVRLALLAAIAPCQIDDDVVHAFRKYFPEDSKLVGALAWTSFTAARKIGTFLHTTPA